MDFYSSIFVSSHCIQNFIRLDECVYHFSTIVITNPFRIKVALTKVEIHIHVDKCFLCDGVSDLFTDGHVHCCC